VPHAQPLLAFGYLASYSFLTIRTLLCNLLFAHVLQTEDLSYPSACCTFDNLVKAK